MPRKDAEAAFQRARRKEHFCRNSLFSYYFHEGWLEFCLHFDEKNRLRRIYLQHKRLESELGVEIPLFSETVKSASCLKPANLVSVVGMVQRN
jgi:hypothetical protein